MEASGENLRVMGERVSGRGSAVGRDEELSGRDTIVSSLPMS